MIGEGAKLRYKFSLWPTEKLPLADVAGGSFFMERGGKALLPRLHHSCTGCTTQW